MQVVADGRSMCDSCRAILLQLTLENKFKLVLQSIDTVDEGLSSYIEKCNKILHRNKLVSLSEYSELLSSC